MLAALAAVVHQLADGGDRAAVVLKVGLMVDSVNRIRRID
jgi:hypothetical protein